MSLDMQDHLAGDSSAEVVLPTTSVPVLPAEERARTFGIMGTYMGMANGGDPEVAAATPEEVRAVLEQEGVQSRGAKFIEYLREQLRKVVHKNRAAL